MTVTFLEDGDVWILENDQMLGSSLEYFDTDDPEENAMFRTLVGVKFV